jgi:hypothetical protein
MQAVSKRLDWGKEILKNGAVEKIRTSTPVKEQRPQRCASTSSATTAFLQAGWCDTNIFPVKQANNAICS